MEITLNYPKIRDVSHYGATPSMKSNSAKRAAGNTPCLTIWQKRGIAPRWP